MFTRLYFCLPENMPDPATGHNLDAAAAHPCLEAELELLAAPDLHALVVETELGIGKREKIVCHYVLLNCPLVMDRHLEPSS